MHSALDLNGDEWVKKIKFWESWEVWDAAVAFNESSCLEAVIFVANVFKYSTNKEAKFWKKGYATKLFLKQLYILGVSVLFSSMPCIFNTAIVVNHCYYITHVYLTVLSFAKLHCLKKITKSINLLTYSVIEWC